MLEWLYMEHNTDLREPVRAMSSIEDNTSWFRDTPHYWAEASLPLTYAVACVEVVSKRSEKARILYNRIIEAWSDAGMKVVFDDIASIIPDKCADIKGYLRPEVIESDSYVLTTGQTWA